MNLPTRYHAKTLMALVAALAWLPQTLSAYPLDGYEETGIGRLEGYRLREEGQAEVDYPPQPPGALLTTTQIDLGLLDADFCQLPPADPAFTSQLVEILGDQADRYSLLVLDMSTPGQPRYASHRESEKQNVGSVGKLLAAQGLFAALADAWPEHIEQRSRVLRESEVIADEFSQTDHHEIRLFDTGKQVLDRHPMRIGDRGNLWEMLDWMLSVSSNAAASMVMREAMLLKHFGQGYPVTDEQRQAFFENTPAAEKTRLFQQTFWQPVTDAGLDLESIRQGSFFTRGGQQRINGGGLSYATARALLEWMVQLERGEIVDPWSSLQIKRLLYVTERRIRYASSPALSRAAVYSKSGSMWACQPEEGFTCRPYHGNLRNYMNSVSIIEEDTVSPAGEPVRLHYIVVLISNVLRENSAVTHQTMGTRIHQLIRTANGLPASP